MKKRIFYIHRDDKHWYSIWERSTYLLFFHRWRNRGFGTTRNRACDIIKAKAIKEGFDFVIKNKKQ